MWRSRSPVSPRESPTYASSVHYGERLGSREQAAEQLVDTDADNATKAGSSVALAPTGYESRSVLADVLASDQASIARDNRWRSVRRRTGARMNASLIYQVRARFGLTNSRSVKP